MSAAALDAPDAAEAALDASDEPAVLDAVLDELPQAAKLRAMAAVRNRETAFFNFLILISSLGCGRALRYGPPCYPSTVLK